MQSIMDFKLLGYCWEETQNILKILFPLNQRKCWEFPRIFFSTLGSLRKRKWCIISIMIRRISFSLFLIYEFHLIIYLFSLISWFKREQVIHIECFLCTIRNSSLINTVSADNNNSILVLMWPLILPSSSCFHESAIIRLLISSKNQTIRIWYEKNIFSFCKCHPGPSSSNDF